MLKIASITTEGKRCFDIDKINKIQDKDIKKFITTSEKTYYDQIKSLAYIVAKKKIKMILVSGPSGSGKTTSANLLAQELIKKKIGSVVVSIDDFFVNLEDTPLLPNGEPDFENITAVDVETFNKFYTDLLTKGKGKMPRFNFLTHKRHKWDNIEIDKDDVIIVEGLHALNPQLLKTNEFNKQILKVYLSVDSVYSIDNKTVINEQDLRLCRRMYRDLYTRGRALTETLYLWKSVCEGEEKYVKPFKREADVLIDTIHPYEIMLYANYLTKALMDLNNKSLNNILEVLEQCKLLDKKNVPQNSLLWEFLVNKE